jgi:3-oxoacyl-(acyl-carrier-protein) synthase
MIAGGFDDISEEGSYELANMQATSNAETEFAVGREPIEMSHSLRRKSFDPYLAYTGLTHSA